MSTYLFSLLGGVLIGLSATLLLLFNGRTAGISGIAGGLLKPRPGELGWRAAFLGGLFAGGAALLFAAPQVFGTAQSVAAGPVIVIIGGLLVGFGTRLGNGCTSGHGVCGISRGAKRSFAATGAFMVTGGVTVFVLRHVWGG